MKRCVMTIATGRKLYWDMALELARSFEYWNAKNNIRMVILTDREDRLPSRLRKTSVHMVNVSDLGVGFSSKLYLDRFAPAEQTLFIDADCLCLRDLTFVFERFRGHDVAVVGGKISEGEWFGDVATVCAQARVSALPKFNGGIYYVEPGAKASAVYARARALEPSYDGLGLVRLRGLPNDELLMALAMAQEGCVGIAEDGLIMGEFVSTPELVALDVLKGVCTLRNPDPPDKRHQSWFPLKEVNPAVIHFLGGYEASRMYRAEALKLRLAMDFDMPMPVAQLIALVAFAPLRLAEFGKDRLRPIYHKLFGPRTARPSSR